MAQLYCVSAKIKTHNNYVPEFELDCGKNNTLYTAGAIGDYKELEFTLQYDSELYESCSDSNTNTLPDQLEIFYNIWLYSIAGNWLSKVNSNTIKETDSGWYFNYDSALHTVGYEYDFSLYGADIAANSQMNIRVTFEAVGCNQFKIHIYFYLIADLDDIITSGLLENHDKLLKNYLDPLVNELENTAESVYDHDKQVKSLVYVIDNIPEEEAFCEHEFSVTFRFYNRDLYDADSPITTSFNLSRNIGVVNDLSKFERTLVELSLIHI